MILDCVKLTAKDSQGSWEMWTVLIPHIPCCCYPGSTIPSPKMLSTDFKLFKICNWNFSSECEHYISMNVSGNANVACRGISKLKPLTPVIPLVNWFDLNTNPFMWTQSAFKETKRKWFRVWKQQRGGGQGRKGGFFNVNVWWSQKGISQKPIQGAAFGTSPSLISNLMIITRYLVVKTH